MMVMSKSAMKQAKVRYNYHDYLLLPEDKRYEILDGDLHMAPAPSIRHQSVTLNLKVALFQYVKNHGSGKILDAPCDVILSDENVVQPDILFVRKEHAGVITEANLQGPPDIAIEVLSPGTRNKDLDLKRKIYARFGVREYWIVDPESETIEILVWSEAGYTSAGIHAKADRLSSPLLPDLNLALSEVFA
jgi:Uma2 family endonuclease